MGEPTTVGDAVFQVLASLAKLASNRELLMEPLLMYLSQTPNLSEPLLWFILQVLENEEAVKCFFKLGTRFTFFLFFIIKIMLFCRRDYCIS